MRFETTTTAFVFVGTHRDRTNARVAGSEFARYLPGVCARVWLAVHAGMSALLGKQRMPALQPVLCLSAPRAMAYSDARIAGLTPHIAAGQRLG
jgi:hypothetical protein